MSATDYVALGNAVFGTLTLLYFAYKGNWRSMLLCIAVIGFGAFWFYAYPTYFSHREPFWPIIINGFLALGVFSQFSPPRPSPL